MICKHTQPQRIINEPFVNGTLNRSKLYLITTILKNSLDTIRLLRAVATYIKQITFLQILFERGSHEGEEKAFFQEVAAFSKSLARRYEYLNKNHLLDPVKLASGEFSTDFSGVDDAKVGDQYVIRRQDALIAHVLKARDLTQFFPIRYGIQDRKSVV